MSAVGNAPSLLPSDWWRMEAPSNQMQIRVRPLGSTDGVLVPETRVYIPLVSPLEAEQMSRQMALLARISPELKLSTLLSTATVSARGPISEHSPVVHSRYLDSVFSSGRPWNYIRLAACRVRLHQGYGPSDEDPSRTLAGLLFA